MLIYIGTPMVAAGIWKRPEVDRIEASLYRKVLRVGNMMGLGPSESPYLKLLATELTNKRTQDVGLILEWIQPGVGS